MTVRHYSSLDTGAPTLAGDLYGRVRTILLACLVYGYGSKPAAGWALGHDVDGASPGFSLGNGDGYINVVPGTNSNSYVAYIMESITNGATGLAEGYNRRSAAWYDGQATSERQSFYNVGLTAASYYWSVVADDKTVVLMIGGNHVSADPANYTYSCLHYFGAYENFLGLTGPATFCSLGGGSSSGAEAMFGGDAAIYGMALRNPFTGLVDQGVSPRYSAAAPQYLDGGLLARANLVPSKILAVRAGLACGGAGVTGSTTRNAAGLLRGIFSEPTLGTAIASQVLALFGASNTWQARITPLTMPGGARWMMLHASPNNPGFFASLADADWS